MAGEDESAVTKEELIDLYTKEWKLLLREKLSYVQVSIGLKKLKHCKDFFATVFFSSITHVPHGSRIPCSFREAFQFDFK